MQKAKKQKGYVLLLAVLISSIILAMSMGVFAISLKEVALATFARDSTRAFAAASRGLECAMFYDRINDQSALDLGYASGYYSSRTLMPYTPFARGNSPEYALLTPSENWPLTGTNLSYFTCAGQSPSSYTAAPTGANSGSSSFLLDFGDSCVQVFVTKARILTTFTANGYSDRCSNISSQRVTQRTIEVSVNI